VESSAGHASVPGYQLFTSKPVIVAFNTDESGLELILGQLGLDPVKTGGKGQVSLCGKLEADLALMSEEEETVFDRSWGLKNRPRSW